MFIVGLNEYYIYSYASERARAIARERQRARESFGWWVL